MKKLLILTLMTFFVFGSSVDIMAQKREINNIKRANLNGIQAITKNDKVIGYYGYFFLEKADRKNNSFRLEIMDTNLKPTHHIDFLQPKRSTLLEAQFNGTHFCFTYIDYKAKSLTSKLYDLEAKSTGTNVISDLDMAAVRLIQTQMRMEDGYYSGTLVPIKDKGFAVIYSVKASGLKVKLDMFDNNGKKQWTADSGVSSKAWEMYSPLYESADYMIGAIMTRPSQLSQKVTEQIHIFDNKTGKLLGKVKTENEKNYFAVNGVDYDRAAGEFLMYGTKYGRKNKKPDFKNNQGLFVKKFNASGKVSQSHYAAWYKDIMTKVAKKDRAKFKKGVSVMIHSITKTDDGKYIAVGEQYNKEVSGLGVASTVLGAMGGGSSTTSMAKIVLYNMMIIEFDQDFNVEKVSISEKPKRNVQLPSGYEFVNEGKIGYFLKSIGLFDFNFYSTNSDRSNFSTVYTSYNRGKANKDNRYTIGVITRDSDNNVVDKKVNLKSRPTSFTAMPGKPGYIGVYEYFRNDKKIVLRMEKLDL